MGIELEDIEDGMSMDDTIALLNRNWDALGVSVTNSVIMKNYTVKFVGDYTTYHYASELNHKPGTDDRTKLDAELEVLSGMKISKIGLLFAVPVINPLNQK